MGLEHEAARSARSQGYGRLLRGGAAVGVVGAAALAFAATRAPERAHAAPDEAWTPPTPKPAPAPAGLSSKGNIPGGALGAEATLGQAKLVHGSDGELYLHVAVDAAECSSKKETRPIDFALVLDTSSSMEEEGKIEVLKRATKELLEKLGPRDRVALVSFSNDARTVFSLGAVADASRRQGYLDAVAKLEPRGGTNISAGLLAGADELRRVEPRPGSVRRIVLMTDGLATFGEKKPDELCKLANALAREGFTVSTIGLGVEYGERLLSDMADSGGGAFHGADKGDRLARTYEVEVESARSLVARNARLILQPEPGVKIETVLIWPSSDGAEGEKVVALGDISGGRHLKAVARLRVPTGVDAATARVVRVALRYDDVRGDKAEPVASPSVALGVELVKDESVAQASTAKEIGADLDKVAVADGLRRLHAATLARNETEVTAALADVKVHLRGKENLEWRDADGRQNCLSVASLAAVCSTVARAGDRELDAEEKRMLKLPNNGVVATGK